MSPALVPAFTVLFMFRVFVGFTFLILPACLSILQLGLLHDLWPLCNTSGSATDVSWCFQSDSFHVEIKELKKEGEELSVGLWKEKMETWMMLMVQQHFGDGVRASQGDVRWNFNSGGAERCRGMRGSIRRWCSEHLLGLLLSWDLLRVRQNTISAESAFKTQHV